MKRQYLVCALLCLQLFAAVPGGAESPQKATVSMRPYKGTRADGWVDHKSSGNLILYPPTRLNLCNKIQRRKTASSPNLDTFG
jgi:hypothetical protein